MPSSGLYQSVQIGVRDELRLDVDGQYPLMVASGTFINGLTQLTTWVANLTAAGVNHWSGAIWYKDPASGTPYTNVDLQVTTGPGSVQQVTATFTGGGQPNRTASYKYVSPYFNPVE